MMQQVALFLTKCWLAPLNCLVGEGNNWSRWVGNRTAATAESVRAKWRMQQSKAPSECDVFFRSLSSSTLVRLNDTSKIVSITVQGCSINKKIDRTTAY